MTQELQANPQGRLRLSLRTIAFSHYNEKARWALDYYGVPYVEYRTLPLLHVAGMINHRAKSQPKSGTVFVTPFLMATPENASESKDVDPITLNDSTAILEFVSNEYSVSSSHGKDPKNNNNDTASTPLRKSLYTDDDATKAKIMALEERFDTILGPHVRRYVFYQIFSSPQSVGRSLGQNGNVGTFQSWIWVLFYPIIYRVLSKNLRITKESAEKSRDIIIREFAHISRVLESQDSDKPYLVGNEFTAADMTLASLASLAVGINENDGYGAWVPKLDQFPEEAKRLGEELRQTTAGKHIVECYRLHRGTKAKGSSYGFGLFGAW